MTFASDLVADFGTFLDTDAFGTFATLSGGSQVAVIFDNAYVAGLGGIGGLVESTGPACIASSADVSSVVQGSTLTINAVAYTVTGVQPDGTGVTTLQLRKA